MYDVKIPIKTNGLVQIIHIKKVDIFHIQIQPYLYSNPKYKQTAMGEYDRSSGTARGLKSHVRWSKMSRKVVQKAA